MITKCTMKKQASSKEESGLFQSFVDKIVWGSQSEALVLSIITPGSSVVKNLPAKQETQVQSLGGEDSLEKEMATHSSVLAWKILWREEVGGLQSLGSPRVGHNWATEHEHSHLPSVVLANKNQFTAGGGHSGSCPAAVHPKAELLIKG